MTKSLSLSANRMVCVVSAVVLTVYLALFLAAEGNLSIVGCLAAGIVLLAVLWVTKLLAKIFDAVHACPRLWAGLMFVMGAVLIALFHANDYVLFLVGTVMAYSIAVLGINVQLGYCGVINFAGASFFGIGGYTAALLMQNYGVTPLVALVAGGVMAALVGCILLLPVLRTSGNYAALVTMAFALLFTVFAQVCPIFGGPQGIAVAPLGLGSYDFTADLELFGSPSSFYVRYDIFALVFLAIVFGFVSRLEGSWMGLAMDAVRGDEVASSCFGISIARWKITAFTAGNFLSGLAGAFYAMMIAYISPANFAFSDSLLFLSILLLGGMGNNWGVLVATAFVVALPEKFQFIQEYRYLLYSLIVVLMLVFRPTGLLTRRMRCYNPAEAA